MRAIEKEGRDPYRGGECGMKDSRKELELAFTDPGRFRRMYTQKDSSPKETLTKRAFIRKGALITTAFLLVLVSGAIAGCSSRPDQAVNPVLLESISSPTLNNDIVNKDPSIVITEDYTSTPEKSPTSTSTPAETPTPTATLPPLIEGGDIEDIIENIEDGDVLWSIFELQKIVNGYSRGSSGTFSDYIGEVRKSLPEEDRYDGLSKVLGKLEKFDQMNTMSLIYSLKDSFPDLIFMDIPEGCDSLIEALPEDLREKMVEFGDSIKKGTNQSYFVERIYDGRALVAAKSNYELGSTYPGLIIMDGIESVDAPAKLMPAILIVGQIEKNGIVYPVGLMINEQKRLFFIILSDEKASEIFRSKYGITLVSNSVLSDHSIR